MLFSVLRGSVTFETALLFILSAIPVVFFALPVHEFAHGFTATKLGDPTPRYYGRMTLNPLAHIDYIGAACILLFGFGWAKPVPVNTRYFKSPKRDMAITALAGPVSNLILALIAMLFVNGLAILSYSRHLWLLYARLFFLYFAQINVTLAVFNLIPIPPLDGSRLLSALLPYRYYYALMRYERYIYFGLLAMIWIGVLDRPLSFLSAYVMNGLQFLAGLPFLPFRGGL